MGGGERGEFEAVGGAGRDGLAAVHAYVLGRIEPLQVPDGARARRGQVSLPSPSL